MSDEPIIDSVGPNAAGPKSVTTPDGTFVQHDLGSQIAADKYMRQRSASRRPFAFLNRMRVMFGRADGNPGYLTSNPDYPNDIVPR